MIVGGKGKYLFTYFFKIFTFGTWVPHPPWRRARSKRILIIFIVKMRVHILQLFFVVYMEMLYMK